MQQQECCFPSAFSVPGFSFLPDSNSAGRKLWALLLRQVRQQCFASAVLLIRGLEKRAITNLYSISVKWGSNMPFHLHASLHSASYIGFGVGGSSILSCQRAPVRGSPSFQILQRGLSLSCASILWHCCTTRSSSVFLALCIHPACEYLGFGQLDGLVHQWVCTHNTCVSQASAQIVPLSQVIWADAPL